uniref:synaptosomal-associated protein 47 isoform X1 n=2 Tax=Myxine glutinosa TaxID=7769 RepID=UPI00358F51F8
MLSVLHNMNAEAISTWQAAYYLPSTRRWVRGRLVLMPGSLRFSTDGAVAPLLSLHLRDISGMKRETTGLIFSAIILSGPGSATHWFSSIRPSRDTVYNVLEHFWRAELLGGPGRLSGRKPTSTRGKELLGLAERSQQRLVESTQALHRQGRQLDGIGKNLENIEGDMAVAGTLLGQLEEPWWSLNWLKPGRSQEEVVQFEGKLEDSCTKMSGQTSIVQVPATYCFGRAGEMLPGSLAILPSGLEVRDGEGKTVHTFRRNEVNELEMQGPYELTVKHRQLGRPDIVFRVLSATMPDVVAVLQLQYRERFSGWEDEKDAHAEESNHGLWGSALQHMKSLTSLKPLDAGAGGDSLQQVQAQHAVLEDDVAAIGQVLSQQKALALDVQTEVDRQNESLGHLCDKTVLTTARIDEASRRATHLIEGGSNRRWRFW